MMNRRFSQMLVGVAAALLLASCGAGRKATADTPGQNTKTETAAFVAEQYLDKVRANASDEDFLTAKLHMKVQMDGKSVGTGGQLRMKRDDVIQITLVDPVLGVAEIGRMEFSKTRVLMIDRIHKQYIDVPYAEVDFLQRARIDFNSLQALFWNEVFQPGQATPKASAFTFVGEDGRQPQQQGLVNIDYKDRLLSYRFETVQPTGALSRTSVTSAQGQAAEFSFDYADFSSFQKRQFPHEMVMTFVMGRKHASLTFTLSSLRNSSDWNTHTEAPKKYTKVAADKILRSLVN